MYSNLKGKNIRKAKNFPNSRRITLNFKQALIEYTKQNLSLKYIFIGEIGSFKFIDSR